MSAKDQNPDALTTRFREQLLLSQARIMELEDARDSLTQGLDDERRLVAAAQSLADGVLDELNHLKEVHSVLEAEFRHMRHMQHVTNEALEESRALLGKSETSVADASRRALELETQLARKGSELSIQSAKVTDLDAKLGEAAGALTRAESQIAQLEAEIANLNALATTREQRLEALAAERQALVDSRSWRWSAPIRAIERWSRRS